MSQPQGPTPPPQPMDVVEFGSAGGDPGWDQSRGPGPAGTDPGPGWLRRSAGLREPRIGWGLGGLGAIALFGSLVGEWSTTEYRYGEDGIGETFVSGAGSAGTWGAAWVVGGLALAVAVGVCLAGPPQVRAGIRVAGLSLAAALLLVMVAASVQIRDSGLSPYAGLNIVSEEVQIEVSVERGLFAVYLALGLFAAALWLAPAHQRAEVPYPGPASRLPAPGPPGQAPPPPPAGGPVADLTVRPAEPLIHPTGDHEWR